MRSPKNPSPMRARSRSAQGRRGRRLRIRWGFAILCALILYSALLVQVETLLSSSSRRTENLEALRDSLRMEFVVASASVSERLSLDSVIPLTERSQLVRCIPDQVALIPMEAHRPEPSIWASVLQSVVSGLTGREAWATERTDGGLTTHWAVAGAELP